MPCSQADSCWVELREFEPLTFSLRRLLLHGRLESVSVRGVARNASEFIVAVVGAHRGHTAYRCHDCLLQSCGGMLSTVWVDPYWDSRRIGRGGGDGVRHRAGEGPAAG